MRIFLSRLTQYENRDQSCATKVAGCSSSDGATTTTERFSDRGSYPLSLRCWILADVLGIGGVIEIR